VAAVSTEDLAVISGAAAALVAIAVGIVFWRRW
jgi:hypothetical protein